MISEGRSTLGLFLPIEAYAGDLPAMTGQIELARRAEDHGYGALRARGALFRDPAFGDIGQVRWPGMALADGRRAYSARCMAMARRVSAPTPARSRSCNAGPTPRPKARNS